MDRLTTLIPLVAFILTVSACSSSKAAKTASLADDEKDWFCEMGEQEDQWACVRDDNPVPTKRLPPVQPEPEALPPAYAPTPEPAPINLEQIVAPEPETVPRNENLPLHKALAYRPDKPTSMLEIPGSFWVVQMVAVSSKAALEEYAKAKRLTGMSAARIANKDKLFYVLLLGIYETRDLAEQAVASIPGNIDEFDPWIRRLSGLQKAMVRGDEIAGTSNID